MMFRCWILIFDSLQHDRLGPITKLKSFLVDEAKEHRGATVSTSSMKGTRVLVPKQPNHCDCGVYLLHYVEMFLQDPDETFRRLLVIFCWLATLMFCCREKRWNDGSRNQIFQRSVL
jgi:hypothetical protein